MKMKREGIVKERLAFSSRNLEEPRSCRTKGGKRQKKKKGNREKKVGEREKTSGGPSRVGGASRKRGKTFSHYRV